MAVHPEARVHAAALVDAGCTIGARTRVWAFAHVLPGAIIGADCNLCDAVYVEGQVRTGDRVTVKNSVALYDGVTLHDDVFVGPNVVFTNDRVPRAGLYKGTPAQFLPTIVERGASIGANATIVCGVRIGVFALVAAGSVVTRDVGPHVVVRGNPARPAGFVCACGTLLREATVCSCGHRYEHGDGGLRRLTPLPST